MKLITKTISVIAVILFYTNSIAQIKNSNIVSVKIYGNCDMCKKTIEKAGNVKKTSKVVWDKDSKLAILTFNSKITNQNAILKRIALAGYDNEKFLAPDDAYAKLAECCRYNRKKVVDAKITTKLKEEIIIQDTVKKKTVSPLLGVYAAYFALKDALINNDGITASTKAKELFKAIDKVPMDKMIAEQHAVWMKHLTKLSYDAEHIKSVTETEHQRDYFSSLSKNMFAVMKVIKPDYPVYLDHCPMYNDGKGGNWISKETIIKNPYYGSKMLTCGNVIEKIK